MHVMVVKKLRSYGCAFQQPMFMVRGRTSYISWLCTSTTNINSAGTLCSQQRQHAQQQMHTFNHAQPHDKGRHTSQLIDSIEQTRSTGARTCRPTPSRRTFMHIDSGSATHDNTAYSSTRQKGKTVRRLLQQQRQQQAQKMPRVHIAYMHVCST